MSASRARADPRVRTTLLVAGGGLLISAAGGVLAAAVSPWAGFAALAGVALGLAGLRDERMALITLIAALYLLPFAVIPVPLGGVRLTLVDAGLSLALLAWLLRLLSHPGQRPVLTPLAAPIFLFSGLAVISFVLGFEVTESEVVRLFLKAINSILLYFTVVNVIEDRMALRWAVVGLVVAATAAALIALMLYALPPETATSILRSLTPLEYPSGNILRYIADTTTLRATGTSVDPNIFGGMLLLILPLLAAHYFSPQSVVDRRILGGIAVLVGLALLLTFSRGSWFGAVVGCLFLGTIRYRRIWLLLALGAALLVLLPQGQPYVERFMAGVNFQDRAALMRLGEYKDALRLIERYPWLGVGFGRAPDIDTYIGASSIYLMMAVEMGLVGLTAFCAVMAVFYRAVLSATKSLDPQVEATRLGALAAVTGALAAGLFDHYFFNLKFPHTAALFWLFVGLAVAASRLHARESEPRP